MIQYFIRGARKKKNNEWHHTKGEDHCQWCLNHDGGVSHIRSFLIRTRSIQDPLAFYQSQGPKDKPAREQGRETKSVLAAKWYYLRPRGGEGAWQLRPSGAVRRRCQVGARQEWARRFCPLLGGFVADIAVRSLVPVPVDDDEATFAIVTGGRDGEISIHSPDRGLKLDGASAIRSPVQRPPRPSTFPRIKYALGRLK